MPSGEVVELEGVPETATEAQIRAKVQAKLGEAPTELSTSWLDTAKVLGSAAGRGIAPISGVFIVLAQIINIYEDITGEKVESKEGADK